ncbi:hypothetical protein D9M71_687580 [compost metagenome]
MLPLAQHHAGTTDLAHARIGNADHRHLGDGRVRQQCGFDLCRVAVEAADDEHVLEAVGNGQVALRVQAPDVTRVQPALGVDGLGGGSWVLEIPLHDVEAAQADFPGLALGQGAVGSVADAHFSAR